MHLTPHRLEVEKKTSTFQVTLCGATPRDVTRLVFQRFLDLYNRHSAAMTVKNSHDQRGKETAGSKTGFKIVQADEATGE